MRLATLVLVLSMLVAAPSIAGCASAGGRGPEPPPVEDVVLRFDSPAALADWVTTGGEWTVEGGRLLGRSIDPTGEAGEYAIYATPFAEIERVVIHGGLAATAKDNFRFAVGAVGVILDWEVEPKNLVHHGYRLSSFGPPALRPGRDAEIVLEQKDRRIRLVVDDRLLWEQEGTLSGTFTLSAAFCTTITVRDVEIRGRPVRGLRAAWPSAPTP